MSASKPLWTSFSTKAYINCWQNLFSAAEGGTRWGEGAYWGERDFAAMPGGQIKIWNRRRVVTQTDWWNTSDWQSRNIALTCMLTGQKEIEELSGKVAVKNKPLGLRVFPGQTKTVLMFGEKKEKGKTLMSVNTMVCLQIHHGDWCDVKTHFFLCVCVFLCVCGCVIDSFRGHWTHNMGSMIYHTWLSLCYFFC